MTTRRDILFGITAGLLGRIVPQFQRRFEATPAPARGAAWQTSEGGILHAVLQTDCFELHDGQPDVLPTVTWREHILGEYYGCTLDEALAQYAEEYDGLPADLDGHVPDEFVVERLSPFEVSSGRAYLALEGYDLGPIIVAGGRAKHFIKFVNGGCPGNDAHGVYVPDLESLALLQRRLDDQGSGLSIVPG